MAFFDHGTEDVGDELEAGAGGRTVIIGAKRKVAAGEFGAEFGVLEAELIGAGFVPEDSDIIIETLDFGEIPGVVEEIAIAESIFEAVGGEARDFVIGDGEELVIGDFARENTVFFELVSDHARATDDLAGAGLDGFLMLGVAVQIINRVFEAGACDVVEETSEGLDLVVGEIPDDEGDADAMGEDGTEVLEVIDGTIVHGGHADVFEALELRGSDIFEKPGRKSRGEDFEIFALRSGERAEGFVLAGGKVERFLARATKETGFFWGNGSGWLGLGLGFSLDGSRGFFGGRLFADGRGGLGRAINLNQALREPEADFLVATLGLIGHLEEVDFGLVMVVEIISNDVLEFGVSTDTNVAVDIMMVFVHDEEDIGAVEILPEALVGAEEAFGIGAVARLQRSAGIETGDGAVGDKIVINSFGVVIKNGRWPVNDFVATSFKVASPIDGAFVKFGASANDEFFHI